MLRPHPFSHKQTNKQTKVKWTDGNWENVNKTQSVLFPPSFSVFIMINNKVIIVASWPPKQGVMCISKQLYIQMKNNIVIQKYNHPHSNSFKENDGGRHSLKTSS